MNKNFGKKPNQSIILEQIINGNMNACSECFVAWTHGGLIPGYEKRGTLVKFSGYLYARTGTSSIGTVYPEESG
jgi:hypothetical protein